MPQTLTPLVSIIIPTYNRSSYIGETLDCILSQTYTNWECIIVDDNSKDYTRDLVEFYREKDPRFFFIERPSNYWPGANSCRNIGLLNSNGKYIQWLDSDDLITPEKIHNQILILQNGESDLATCSWGRFHSKASEAQPLILRTNKDYHTAKQFLMELGDGIGYFPIHSYLMSREVIEKAGPWLEGLMVNQDGEFMMRVIANSNNIKFAKKGYALYRRSSHPSTSQYNKQKLIDLINSWKIIEGYLNIKFKDANLSIIQSAKKSIYSVSKQWPEIIEENQDFFYNIEEDTSTRRIKAFISRHFSIFKKI